jgi:hypothetical protein
VIEEEEGNDNVELNEDALAILNIALFVNASTMFS